jgi:hypothetical protein
MLKKIALYIPLLGFLASCVSVDVGSFIVPGETLDKKGNYYIVFSEDDQQALHETLRENMVLKGLSAESGFKDRMPENINYLVEYGGQWQWDITWYLLNFNVRIYDPKTKLLIASANSLRTSLGRKKAEEVVSETLAQLFMD